MKVMTLTCEGQYEGLVRRFRKDRRRAGFSCSPVLMAANPVFLRSSRSPSNLRLSSAPESFSPNGIIIVEMKIKSVALFYDLKAT